MGMSREVLVLMSVLALGCAPGSSSSSAWDEVGGAPATSGGYEGGVPIAASVRTNAEYAANPAAPAAEPAPPPQMDVSYADEDMAMPVMAVNESGGGGGLMGRLANLGSSSSSSPGAQAAPTPPPQPPRIAQAPNPQATTGDQAQQTATDAVQSPQQLLVYTAGLVVAVHHVEERMDALEAMAREVGGYLGSRAERQITIRIPAPRFDEVMERIGEGSEVLARRVNVVDVGDQYRDMRLRIANYAAMRERIVALLDRAEDVETALAIEQELQRITLELERLRGQLRNLSSQIAFSTITVTYQNIEELQVNRQFQLPFRWLRELGIDRLLRVR